MSQVQGRDEGDRPPFWAPPRVKSTVWGGKGMGKERGWTLEEGGIGMEGEEEEGFRGEEVWEAEL